MSTSDRLSLPSATANSAATTTTGSILPRAEDRVDRLRRALQLTSVQTSALSMFQTAEHAMLNLVSPSAVFTLVFTAIVFVV